MSECPHNKMKAYAKRYAIFGSVLESSGRAHSGPHGLEMTGGMHGTNELAHCALIGSTGRVMGGSRWGDYTHASDAPEWIGVDEKVRDEECSICLTAFSDWLPTPDDASRSAPDLFACRTHAVCRAV